jgi:hypothetical protein
MMIPLLFLLYTFLTPQVRLSTGQSARLIGKGPPVVFNSGLFGTMPHYIYSDFVRRLSRNLTVVVLNDPRPWRKSPPLDEIAEALRVQKVGLITHSSFDGCVLSSERLQSAVIMDPIVTPSLSLQRRKISNKCNVLVLKAQFLYEGTTALPDYLCPDLEVPCETAYFMGVGHADILDDRWADLATSLFPFMAGTSAPQKAFESWNQISSSEVCEIRADYRTRVTQRAVSHLLQSNLPHGTSSLSTKSHSERPERK